MSKSHLLVGTPAKTALQSIASTVGAKRLFHELALDKTFSPPGFIRAKANTAHEDSPNRTTETERSSIRAHVHQRAR
jgi:hypothetical protein